MLKVLRQRRNQTLGISDVAMLRKKDRVLVSLRETGLKLADLRAVQELHLCAARRAHLPLASPPLDGISRGIQGWRAGSPDEVCAAGVSDEWRIESKYILMKRPKSVSSAD